MSRLADLSGADLTQATLEGVMRLLQGAITHDDLTIGTGGQVIVNGVTFLYTGGALTMLGYCPVCNQEVPSRPLKRLADIADNQRSFRPGKHDCMDV